MAWSKMADLALSDEEVADYGPNVPARDDAPQYPWGLRISLCEAELSKLGLDVADADVGDIVDLRAFATVTSVSQSKKADGTSCCRVELQIEKMAVENESDEAPGEEDDED